MPKKYFYFLIIFSFFLILGLIKPNLIKAATLSLSPSSGSYTVGDTFEVQIILDTQGAETDGVDIHYLNYDPSLLEVQDADTGQAGIQISPGTLYSNTPLNSVDSVNGLIDFSQTTAGGSTYNGSGVLATITFKVLSQGTANVTFDFTSGETTDTNVASSGQDVLTSVADGNYTFNPTAQTCEQVGGSCKSNPCNTYQDCVSLEATCSSGYCCSGNCTTVPPDDGNDNNGGDGGGGGGGNPPADTTPPGKIKNLSAIASSTEIILSWTNPSDSDFAGVLIRRSQESAPASISEGIQVMKEKATTFTDANLTSGLTYYYSLFTYDHSGNYSTAVSITITPREGGGDISYPDNTLLKGSSDKVYVILSGQRRWIASAEVFTASGYNWEDVVIVSDEVLSSIPEGDPITSTAHQEGLTEGDIIRAIGDYRVYIINEHHYKRHIFNPDIFNMYDHLKWENIKDVTQATLDSFTTSDLYRAIGDSRIYSLEEVDEAQGIAIKHHLNMTAQQFIAKGYKWEQVFVVNPEERDYYQTGDDITADDVTGGVSPCQVQAGSLVRATGGTKVYYINDTPKGLMKRWLINAEVFLSYGNKWEDIIEISSAQLETYPLVNLVRSATDDKIYYLDLDSRTKHWIKTTEAFNSRGYDWDRVVIVNQVELEAYQDGEEIE